MMGGNDQDVIVALQAKQTGTEKRSVHQIERMPGFFKQQLMELFFAVCFGDLREGNSRQREAFVGRNDLDKATIFFGKRSTQDLVSSDQHLKATLERIF